MKRALLLFVLALPVYAASPSATYFGGVTLVDQNGKSVDLYRLMAGRTIVMNSFFATCTSSCPVIMRTIAAVQNRFGDRVGKDLVLVSITVDPANDTPERLKAYAKAIGAQSGWYFLTGTKEQVDAALHKIGQYTPSPGDHTNVIIVGNEKTGLWKKAFGLAKPADIVSIVDGVLNDDGTQPAR